MAKYQPSSEHYLRLSHSQTIIFAIATTLSSILLYEWLIDLLLNISWQVKSAYLYFHSLTLLQCSMMSQNLWIWIKQPCKMTVVCYLKAKKPCSCSIWSIFLSHWTDMEFLRSVVTENKEVDSKLLWLILMLLYYLIGLNQDHDALPWLKPFSS
jgi:hypothetical protein